MPALNFMGNFAPIPSALGAQTPVRDLYEQCRKKNPSPKAPFTPADPCFDIWMAMKKEEVQEHGEQQADKTILIGLAVLAGLGALWFFFSDRAERQAEAGFVAARLESRRKHKERKAALRLGQAEAEVKPNRRRRRKHR